MFSKKEDAAGQYHALYTSATEFFGTYLKLVQEVEGVINAYLTEGSVFGQYLLGAYADMALRVPKVTDAWLKAVREKVMIKGRPVPELVPVIFIISNITGLLSLPVNVYTAYNYRPKDVLEHETVEELKGTYERHLLLTVKEKTTLPYAHIIMDFYKDVCESFEGIYFNEIPTVGKDTSLEHDFKCLTRDLYVALGNILVYMLRLSKFTPEELAGMDNRSVHEVCLATLKEMGVSVVQMQSAEQSVAAQAKKIICSPDVYVVAIPTKLVITLDGTSNAFTWPGYTEKEGQRVASLIMRGRGTDVDTSKWIKEA